MRSIQRNLTLTVAGASVLLVTLSGTLLYFYLRHSLLKQFDDLLAAEAQAATGMVQQDRAGRLEFSFPRDAELRVRAQKEYFEVYRNDGQLLQRSPLLGHLRLSQSNPVVAAGDLPAALDNLSASFWTVRLPNGHPGRATAVKFVAEMEEIERDGDTSPPGHAATPYADARDDPPTSSQASAAGNRLTHSVHRASAPLVLILAEDHSDTDHTLRVLFSSLLVAAALLSCGAAAVVSISIRRGLKPLRYLSQQVERIGPSSLNHRFEMDGLPAELTPLCRRLNQSLERLQEGFNRERRFTAAVAHELRTPIAELRALGEVAVKWPGENAETSEGFRDVLDIAHQMARVVSSMLTIARSEAGCELFTPLTVDLCALIADAYSPLKSIVAERQLKLRWHMPAEAHVVSDYSMLLQLVANLFSNAVDYTPAGGVVEYRMEAIGDNSHGGGNGWVLIVANENQTLEAADIPHLFEPFWRKDAARTPGDHSGLGLAVVAAYARVIGAVISARLPRPDTFCITVTIPNAPAHLPNL